MDGVQEEVDGDNNGVGEGVVLSFAVHEFADDEGEDEEKEGDDNGDPVGDGGGETVGGDHRI